jgi:hypothetical protein
MARTNYELGKKPCESCQHYERQTRRVEKEDIEQAVLEG